jgi:hypothetical protein
LELDRIVPVSGALIFNDGASDIGHRIRPFTLVIEASRRSAVPTTWRVFVGERLITLVFPPTTTVPALFAHIPTRHFIEILNQFSTVWAVISFIRRITTGPPLHRWVWFSADTLRRVW